MFVNGASLRDRPFVPNNWVFFLIARILFRSGRSFMMSYRIFGVTYRFVNLLGMVYGFAMVFRLIGFCRLSVVHRSVS